MRGGMAGISNAVSSNRRSEIFFAGGVDFDLREMRVDLPVGQFARKGRFEVLQIIRFRKATAALFVVRTFLVVEIPNGMRARGPRHVFFGSNCALERITKAMVWLMSSIGTYTVGM